mmetsp:Transcript_18651/g.28783  ORF Transcript_18651/g.28783 Transcript_18651/m.28783 type:complete len:149 (+) Transcript_18651:171-617(+)
MMKTVFAFIAIISVASAWVVAPRVPSRMSGLHMASEGTEYSVTLGLPPLGIIFEDIGSGYPPKGVKVVGLAPGGKGEICGKIQVGDKLKTCSAIRFLSGSSKYTLEDIDCTELDFDTVVSALTSNQSKFGCDRVDMTFIRPAEEESTE